METTHGKTHSENGEGECWWSRIASPYYFSMRLNPIGSINGFQPLVEGRSSVARSSRPTVDKRRQCVQAFAGCV